MNFGSSVSFHFCASFFYAHQFARTQPPARSCSFHFGAWFFPMCMPTRTCPKEELASNWNVKLLGGSPPQALGCVRTEACKGGTISKMKWNTSLCKSCASSRARANGREHSGACMWARARNKNKIEKNDFYFYFFCARARVPTGASRRDDWRHPMVYSSKLWGQ